MKRFGGKIGRFVRHGKTGLAGVEWGVLTAFPHIIGHSGIPQTADSLAYEPIHRLLAIGTSDGRIKLLGQYGVEKLLQSESPQKTTQIFFLNNRGTIVRVEEGGSVELWNVSSGLLVHRLYVPRDSVTCVCAIPGEPYLLLGCESGDLRVASIVDGNNEPTSEGREVKGLCLLNYKVSRSNVSGHGKIQSCHVCISTQGPLAMLTYPGSGVMIWNIRYQQGVVCVPEVSKNPQTGNLLGPITVCCWVGHVYGASYFATGHESGDVFIWKVPESPMGSQAPPPASMAHYLRVVGLGSAASRVSGLNYVSGKTDALLVMGGQSIEEPDTLTRIPLPNEEGGKDGKIECIVNGASLPWFGTVNGYSLVPPDGSLEEYDDPVALLVLTEGGKLVLHDFELGCPIPFSLPFQSLSPLSCSRFVSIPRTASGGAEIVSMDGLMKQVDNEDDVFGGGIDPKYTWVMSGGEPPKWESQGEDDVALYVTGHECGSVRLWNMMGEAPIWLGTLPAKAVKKQMGLSLRCVSACEMSIDGRLLIVGYERGDVLVYKFGGGSGVVECSRLVGVGKEVVKCDQAPGFQLIIQISCHHSEIKALRFDMASGLLAIGDASGVMSIVHIDSSEMKLTRKISQVGLKDFAFGLTSSLSLAHERVSHLALRPATKDKSESTPPSEHVVYVATVDSSLAVVDTDSGKVLSPNGAWLKPKNASQVLMMSLLDGFGHPVQSQRSLTTEANFHSASKNPDSSTGNDGLQDVSGLNEEVKCEPQEDNMEGSSCVDPPPAPSPDELPTSPDSNTDELLAAAVAEMEASSQLPDETALKKGGTIFNKFKPPKNWPMGRKKGKQALKDGNGNGNSPGQSCDVTGGVQGSCEEAAENVDSESGSIAGDSEGHSPTGPEKSTLSQTSVHLPSSFILVVTTNYIRLYSPDSISTTDRSTIHKVTFTSPIQFAYPFSPPQSEASGLITLSTNHQLQIYSLPSLDLVEDVELDTVLGWKWGVESNFGGKKCTEMCAVVENGQMVLCGLFGELVRVGLVDGGFNMEGVQKMYDWDLAAAAHSARRASLRGSETTSEKGEVHGSQPIKKRFNMFLDVARKARDEFDKAMKMPSTRPSTESNAPQDLQTLFLGSGLYQEPELSQTEVHTEVEVRHSDGRGEAARNLPVAGPVTVAQQSTAQSTTGHRDAREELLSGARTGVGSEPQIRTADEIRAKYGRKPRNAENKARNVGSLMAENRDMLMERGEKLRGINDKTEDLANDAANFASLAKQLADRERNKKWYQL